MKLILLHGDHEVRSRDRLFKFIQVAKKRGWEVIKTSETDSDVAEILASNSLFGSDMLVVSEDIKEFTDKITKWIEKKRDKIDTNLVIYHKGTLGKRAIKKLPKPDKVEEFELPKEIWSFVDSLFPGNARNSLKLFESVIQNEPPEFIFAVVAKQFRDMFWAKKDPSGIPYPGWRKGKIRSQANKYSEQQLLKLFLDLAEIDIKTKTSKAEIKDELEFFIATELK